MAPLKKSFTVEKNYTFNVHKATLNNEVKARERPNLRIHFWDYFKQIFKVFNPFYFVLGLFLKFFHIFESIRREKIFLGNLKFRKVWRNVRNKKKWLRWIVRLQLRLLLRILTPENEPDVPAFAQRKKINLFLKLKLYLSL